MIHKFRDLLSRIARYPDRPAEAAAHTASLVAVVTTLLMVGTGQVAETNPVSAWLHESVKIETWAVLTPIGVGAVFRISRVLPWDRVKRKTEQTIVAVLGLDAVGNLAMVAMIGPPESLILELVAKNVILTLGVAFGVYHHREIIALSETISTPSWETGRAIGLSIIILLAIPAGVVFVGTQPVTEDQSGTASAAASDVKWNKSISTNAIQSGPTIVNGVVYLGGHDGNLYALDADTGKELWNFSTGGAITGSPTVAGGTVYVGSYDNSTYAIDADTGKKKWEFKAGNHFSASPTYKNGIIYIGSRDTNFYALDASDGSKVWSYNTGGKITEAATVANGSVFVGSDDGNMYAFNPKDGTVQWKASVGDKIRGAPTFHEGVVVFGKTDLGSADDGIKAVDASDGSVLWGISSADENSYSAPTAQNGKVYIGIDNDRVYKLDVQTGNVDNYYLTNNNVRSGPTFSNGTIYVGTNANALRALDAGSLNQKWAYGTGSSVASSPTVANGTVYFGTNNGNVIALDTGHSKDSSGSRVKLNTQGHVGDAIPSTDITVQVLTKSGSPVENATVESYGVNTRKLKSTVDDLEARSNELLDEAQNPRPGTFPDAINIEQDVMKQAGSRVPVAHTPSDWQDTSLSPPRFKVSDNRIVISVWNPTDDPGFLQEDKVTEDLPGQPASGKVVLEQVDHKNDTVNRYTVKTDGPQEYNLPFTQATVARDHSQSYRVVTVPDGFYWMYVKGSGERVPLVVGNPANIIEQELRTEAKKLSQQAQSIQDKIKDGKFRRKTVTTNSTGHATITVKKPVKVVAFQAWKGDGSLITKSNPDPSALRQLRKSGYEGSIYLSTRPKRVNLNEFDAANDTAKVKVRKWSATPYGNLSRFENLAQQLRDELLNATTAQLRSAFEDRLKTVQRENLEQRFRDLANLIRSNPAAREYYLNQTGRSEIPKAADLTKSELRQDLRVMQTSLATQPSTGAAGETTTSVGDGVADFTATLTGNYEPDDIAVFAHYSNGTSRAVADEYVTVDQSLVQDQTEIRVRDFPIGKEDPAQVGFEVKAANSQGVDSVRDSVVNPAFGGEVPNIEAVDVSTLRPGPNEPVEVTLRAAEDSGYGSLKSVRVFAPDGTELSTTLDGETASFTTNGQGTYTIRATYTDSTGAKFVKTVRIKAQEARTNAPPTVRIQDGGDTVLAGSGLRSARVEDTSDGKRVTAIVPGDADQPSSIHVRGSDAFSGDVTVNVVQGELEESIDKHVGVVIHTQLNEKALVYRNGRDQPIARDGSTQYGDIETRTGPDGTEKQIIRTYSDASGQLKLEVSRDPGFFERALFDARTSGISLPSIGMLYNAVVIFDKVPQPPASVVEPTVQQPLLDEADPGEIVAGDAAAAMEVIA